MTAIKTQCCIAGGGPAGMMLGFLLARAGVNVVVLEKHGDFLRDFRGDTIHPSTLEVVAEALAPSAGAAEAAAAARRLAAHKPDLVAMDCMSYTPVTKEWIKPALGVPALLAITATGRVLREMLE